MRRFLLYSAAALAVAVGPSMAIAQCGTEDCAVGAAGQGGESSGGMAPGSRVVQPLPLLPDSTASNSRNENGKPHGDQEPAVHREPDLLESLVLRSIVMPSLQSGPPVEQCEKPDCTDLTVPGKVKRHF
jgi:hypothetical protein